MVLETVVFGKIEIEEDKVVQFPHGIPGFEESQQFVLLSIGDDIPFSYLQCIDNEKLSLLVAEPFGFYPDYEFTITDVLKEELHIEAEDQVVVLTVVSVRDHLADATVNLLAPIVINHKSALGRQIILHDSDYMTKHRLLPESVKGEQV
ncbi:MAG: flagellar assembly protein FliW [Paenibacillaceae bacterium]